MYNPENHELPAHDDPRLTDYIYGYDVIFVHVLAFKADEGEASPFVGIDFEGPFRVNVPFHFMMWPETTTTIEFEELFDIEQLNPKSAAYPATRAKAQRLLGIDPKWWQPSLSGWRKEAQAQGCDRLAIVRYRVRYEWTVRAWQGLNLQHLQSEMDSVEWALEFVKDFDIPEGTLLLETTEPEDPRKRTETLQIKFPTTPMELKVNPLTASANAKQSRRSSPGPWSRLKDHFRF